MDNDQARKAFLADVGTVLSNMNTEESISFFNEIKSMLRDKLMSKAESHEKEMCIIKDFAKANGL